MTSQHLNIVVVLAVFLIPFLASAAYNNNNNNNKFVAGSITGGWSPIKNLNDPYVREIAAFAVSEYNKQSKAKLTLESILKGESQIVSGTNYRLDVFVKDGAITLLYEAVVWDKQHLRKLISFTRVE